MANRNILDAGDELLEQSAERILPTRSTGLPSPESAQLNMSPDNAVPLGETALPEAEQLSDLEMLGQEANSLLADPIPYRPYNYNPRITPPALARDPSQLSGDLDFLTAGGIASGQQQVLDDEFPLGETFQALQELAPTVNRRIVQSPGGGPRVDFKVVENQIEERSQRIQNQAVAPGAGIPLIGVARSINDGQPFTGPATHSVLDFFRNTAGVDLQGIETEREETAAPTLFDRVLARGRNVAASALSGPLGAAAMIPGPIGDAFQNVNPLMADEEAAGTTRRILSELMSIVGQRTRNRVEEVGLGQTVAENTLGRLPSGGRAAQSLATSIMRRENPIRPFFPSTQFVGSGLGPQPGPEGNGSVLHELLVNSPDARNFLRDMEPVINEAGQVGFNPGSGQFGEFGQAGSLSAALWLMNIPEGIFSGALYDLSDLTRKIRQNGRLDSLLSLASPFFYAPLSAVQPEGEAPMDNQNRLDTVGALFGRDYGFTQQWTEDRYLSVIGNPGLRWIPQGYGLQTGLGFVLDLANGGLADFAITDPLMGVTRVGRRAARNTLTEAIENIDPTTAIQRNIITQLQPSATQLQTVTRQLDVPAEEVAQSLARHIDEPISHLDHVVNTTVRSVDPPVPVLRTYSELLADNADSVARAVRQVDSVDITRALRNVDVNLSTAIRPIADDVVDALPVPAVVRQLDGINEARVTLQDMPEVVESLTNQKKYVIDSLTPEEVPFVVRGSDEFSFGAIDADETFRLAPTNVASNQSTTDVLPLVPISSLTPSPTKSVASSLLQYRVAPESLNPMDLMRVRRSDESIVALSQFLDTPSASVIEPTSAMARISNVNALEYLEGVRPDLFSRFGKPINPNIEEPIKGINLGGVADNLGSVPSNPVSVAVFPQQAVARPRLPDVAVPTSPEQLEVGRQQLEDLARSYGPKQRALHKAIEADDPDAIAKAADDVAQVEHEVKRVYANYPEIAFDNSVKSLPVELQPAGPGSRQAAVEYVVTQREFFYETSQLRKLRNDLAETDKIVVQQQQVLAELPRLERTSIQDAITTATIHGDNRGLRAASDISVPTTEIQSRGLRQVTPERTNAGAVRGMPELSSLSESQKSQLMRNEFTLEPADAFIPAQDIEKFGVDGNFYLRNVEPIREVPTIPDNFAVLYHGTKAKRMEAPGFSLTNELGPGLYVTPNHVDALNYARAKPARDVVVTNDIRPKYTPQGRTFQVGLSPEAKVFDVELEESKAVLRNVMMDSLSDYPDIRRRFSSWSKKHSPSEWWLYLRSQFLKDNMSQLDYAEFAMRSRYGLVDEGVDALKDGNNINILNPDLAVVSRSFEDTASDGTLMEGLLYRYRVDLSQQARLNGKGSRAAHNTTLAIVEQDRLELDRFARDQLAEQAVTQERRAVDATTSMSKAEISLDDAVRADVQRNIANKTDDNLASTTRAGSKALREQAADDFCP
jgi:hypothetical protein